ncbi:hypothetical protein Sjap_023654 [Stephania japonica]|uniref:Protein kinase domain-containing protein n=1 Tax=Stephania japonica TaxID=461633 RepID=A0AAP0HMX3_9MAGN
MGRRWRLEKTIWVFFVSLFVLLGNDGSAVAETEEVKRSLMRFLGQISSPNPVNLNWSMSTDPCNNHWMGVSCNLKSTSVKKIILENLGLSGSFDANSLCSAETLSVLSLKSNSISGGVPEEIGKCKQLTHLYLSGNKFSGNIPLSLSNLNNLKRLDVSFNNFSGALPDLPRVSGLKSFLAENNQLSGAIPEFDFTNLDHFNVSNNNFSGPVPDMKGRFGLSSIAGNPLLCGKPSPNACPRPPPPPPPSKSSSGFHKSALFYSGYALLGLLLVIVVVFTLIKRKKAKEARKVEVVKVESVVDGNGSPNNKSSPNRDSREASSDKNGNSRSSVTSAEAGMVSSSLTILSSPVLKGMQLDELLRAPAELIGRGRHGSLYKVFLDGGKTLAVKRIKGWDIPVEAFELRMRNLDRVRHPNVLPIIAFYGSKEEKLLVYEFQENGSLFNLLHGTKEGRRFDWGSRLSVAASVAEALAYMHVEFQEDGIAHGNLKSTNILFNSTMDPCIGEYGLMVINNSLSHNNNENEPSKETSAQGPYLNFKVDLYAFGIVLLELLTGKLVHNNEPELARWVQKVVREEWTAEIFDNSLVVEGVSEDRLVSMLQVALKCINPCSEERPSIYQVALMINTIREEEERSIASEPSSNVSEQREPNLVF